MTVLRNALLLGTLFLLVGCADTPAVHANAGSAEASVTIDPELPVIDWENPLGSVPDSLEAAESELAFTPKPPDLGKPVSLSLSDPETWDKKDRLIAWVYSDPDIGEYYISEMIPTVTQEQLEELATCQPAETGCSTEGWSLQTIRSGITALVIYAPESKSASTTVSWLEGGLQYTLEGPRSKMTQDRAIEIANQV